MEFLPDCRFSGSDGSEIITETVIRYWPTYAGGVLCCAPPFPSISDAPSDRGDNSLIHKASWGSLARSLCLTVSDGCMCSS